MKHEEQGRRLAAVLSGSWRTVPPRVDFEAADWGATVERLVETGAGGLGWWRVRGSGLEQLPATVTLRDAYRFHSIHAAVRERQIAQVLDRCRAIGVRPLVAKGWAVSRFYPEPGVRPYGDIDLFVRPEEHAAAVRAVADFEPRHLIDLHRGCADLADRPLDALFERADIRSCGTVQARVAGAEDELRHVCVHFLRHGAWRPLWLSDVAAIVESAGERFDWDYCLRGSRQRTQAVVCAIGLARQLLGARIEHTPLVAHARRLPHWLVPSVLSQWGRRHELNPAFATALRSPARAVAALWRRWPNPVESTMSRRGPFNDAPRLPFQLADCVVRLGDFLFRLARPGSPSWPQPDR
jgi:hypothetical protein